MIAAGTSAPMPIAAKAMPANHDGKLCRYSAGTAKLLPNCLKPSAYSGRLPTPAAIAKKPTSANNPSMNEYPGSIAALRRMARPLDALRMPVSECG